MQVQLQKCNGCGAVNVDQVDGWIRINGATANVKKPSQTVMDFCPSCAGSTQVSQLPAVVESALKQSMPQAVRQITPTQPPTQSVAVNAEG